MLTGLTWFAVRLASIPGDLQAHDFEVKVLNEDVELWVADTYRELTQELRAIAIRTGARIEDGSHLNARSAAKTRVLHRWRDRLHTAERELIEIQNQESWLHRLWRHLPNYADDLSLTSAERVVPVIEEFRRHVETPGGKSAKVRDPSRFSLDDLLEEIGHGSPLV